MFKLPKGPHAPPAVLLTDRQQQRGDRVVELRNRHWIPGAQEHDVCTTTSHRDANTSMQRYNHRGVLQKQYIIVKYVATPSAKWPILTTHKQAVLKRGSVSSRWCRQRLLYLTSDPRYCSYRSTFKFSYLQHCVEHALWTQTDSSIEAQAVLIMSCLFDGEQSIKHQIQQKQPRQLLHHHNSKQIVKDVCILVQVRDCTCASFIKYVCTVKCLFVIIQDNRLQVKNVCLLHLTVLVVKLSFYFWSKRWKLQTWMTYLKVFLKGKSVPTLMKEVFLKIL